MTTDKREITDSAFIKDGRLFIVRKVLGVDINKVTEWDLLSDTEKKSYESTPMSGPCADCGEEFATEAEFAKHFIITDIRFIRSGTCVKKFEEINSN